MSNGATLLPVGLWSEEPLSHLITSILVLPSGDSIVTGSTDASVIIWSIENDLIKPKWCVYALSGSVKFIVYSGSIRGDQFVTCLSTSNEFCLIKTADGSCQELKIDQKFQHKYIQSHKPNNLDYNIILCNGNYSKLIIIHAISLNHLYYLETNDPNCLISGFVIFGFQSASQDVILGITNNGTVNLWTINGQESCGQEILPNETKSIDKNIKIICLDYSISNPRIVLIITNSCWMILDAFTCQITITKECPANEILIYGSFISSNLVVIQMSSGKCFLYYVDHGPKTNTVANKEKPLIKTSLVALLSPIDPLSKDSLANHRSQDFSPEGLKLFTKLKASTDSDGNEYIYLLTTSLSNNGTIFLWIIPANRIYDLENRTGKYSLLRPKSIVSLADLWNRLKPAGLSSITPKESNSPENHPTVSILIYTCTSMVTNQTSSSSTLNQSDFEGNPSPIPPRLVIGMSNGDIIVSRLKDSLEKILSPPNSNIESESLNSSSNNPGETQSFYQYRLSGHKDSITSLIHPASEQYNWHLNKNLTVKSFNPNTFSSDQNYRYDPVILLSASNDLTVRVWNINPTFEKGSYRGNFLKMENGHASCLHIFTCFSSPVDQFLIGPPCLSEVTIDHGSFPYQNYIIGKCSDGNFTLINIRDRRSIISCPDSYGSTCPKSSTNLVSQFEHSFIVAFGWRLSEGLLFVLRSNLTIVIWDVHTGNIERYESDSTAIDIWEGVEWKCLVCDIKQLFSTYNQPHGPFLRSFSRMVYHNSIAGRLGENLCQPLYLATSSYSAGIQSNFIGLLQRDGFTQISQEHRHFLSPMHFLRLGRIVDRPLKPACHVFAWDLERIITYIMTENHTYKTVKEIENGPYKFSNAIVSLHSVGILLKFLLSICYSWNRNSSMDNLLRQLLSVNSDGRYISLENESLAFGFISDRGSITLSMPGFMGKLQDKSLCSLRHFYLSNTISSNLTLISLSLCDVFLTITTDLSEFLLGVKIDNLNSCYELFKAYASYICTEHLEWINRGGKEDPCPIVFYSLLAKWQDPCLPIRYAGRTLLLSILDTIGHHGRSQLLKWWQRQLPPWLLLSSNSSNGDTTKFERNSLNISVDLSSSDNNGKSLSKAAQSIPFVGSHGIGSTGLNGDGEPFSWLQTDLHSDWSRIITEPCIWYPVVNFNQSEKIQLDNNGIALVLITILLFRYSPKNNLFLNPMITARDKQIYKQKTLDPSIEKLTSPMEKDKFMKSCQKLITYQGLAVPLFQKHELKDPKGDNAIELDHSISRNLYTFCLNSLLNQFPLLTANHLNCDPKQVESVDEHQQRISCCINRANEILRILVSSPGHSLSPSFGLLKRTLVDLLGRNFFLWQSYSDVSQLLNAILTILSNCKLNLEQNEVSNELNGQPLTDIQDMIFSLRECFWSIGFSNPQLLTINLSLEIKKAKSNPASVQPMPGDDKSKRHTYANISQNIGIKLSQMEILHLLEVLCITRPMEMSGVLVDVIEVILVCVNPTKLKDRGLFYVAPAVQIYSSIASSIRAQKICVGSMNGSLTFFDYKTGRYYQNQEHKYPVSAVEFHPDGKLMASYSEEEKIVKIWQLSTTGLFSGITGSSVGQHLKMISMHPVPPLFPPMKTSDSMGNQESRESKSVYSFSIEWIDNKNLNIIHITGITRQIKIA